MSNVTNMPHHSRAGDELIRWEGPECWIGEPEPEIDWLLEGWLPRGTVVLLTGPGGVGKSLAMQQLCSSFALDRSFINLPEKGGETAWYLTCEDDLVILKKRQWAINKALGVTNEDYGDGRLMLTSMRGQVDSFLFGEDLRPTPFHERLEAALRTLHPSLLVLDNNAQLFDAEDGLKRPVARFLGLLDRLAMDTGTTIILLGHPSKAGEKAAGSAAWTNQVRTHIYMSRPDPDADGFFDGSRRIIALEKANYAEQGSRIECCFRDLSFFAPGERDRMDSENRKNAQAAAENDKFLRLLDILTAQRRAVSTSNRAGNYAPKAMVMMPEAGHVTVSQLARAMERLLSLGAIVAKQELWKDGRREWTYGIARAESGNGRAGRLPVASSREPSDYTQGIENTCRTVADEQLPDGCRTVPDGNEQVIDFPAGRLPVGGAGTGGGKSPPYRGGFIPLPPGSHSDDDGTDWEPL